MINYIKIVISTLACLLISTFVFGQSPEAISYQAVIRNASSKLVPNTQVGMQISILQTLPNGTTVYSEVHTPTTNANGLVTVEIGKGASSGDFSAIDWSTGPYFIKTETDPEGGTNYTITGVNQLLSVPYALHAKTAETVANVNITGSEIAFSGWDKDASDDFDGDYGNLMNAPDLSGISDNQQAIQDTAAQIRADMIQTISETDPVFQAWKDAGISITEDQISDLQEYLTEEVDGSVTNEIQGLQLVGNTLIITNNATDNAVDLSSVNTDTQLSDDEVKDIIEGVGYDSSETNEIQDLSFDATNNTLTITNNATATTVDLSSIDTDTQLSDDAVKGIIQGVGYDSSETNEIQDLSFDATNNTLTITNNATATTVDLSSIDTQLSDDAVKDIIEGGGYDLDASNEIQTLSFDDTSNELAIVNADGTEKTTVDLSSIDTQLSDDEVKDIIEGAGYDLDASNEIQTLSFDDTSNELAIVNADGTKQATVDLSSIDTQLSEDEVKDIIEGAGYDLDASNEIQTLSFDGTSNELAIVNADGTKQATIDLSSIDTDTKLTDSEVAQMGFIKNADETDPRVPQGNTVGQMQYWDGSNWVTVPPGNDGAILILKNGVPTWAGSTLSVTTTTGAIWMDRNLGASQVATSKTDAAAYGDLYQWGRASDGHESRTSGTTTTQSDTDTPGHDRFIVTSTSDWRETQNDNLWQGAYGTNNPCPEGYRLPTSAEWEAELNSWSSKDIDGAFASPLKLTFAGYRNAQDGALTDIGSRVAYWSSTIRGVQSSILFFNPYPTVTRGFRGSGYSVRCIFSNY